MYSTSPSWAFANVCVESVHRLHRLFLSVDFSLCRSIPVSDGAKLTPLDDNERTRNFDSAKIEPITLRCGVSISAVYKKPLLSSKLTVIKEMFHCFIISHNVHIERRDARSRHTDHMRGLPLPVDSSEFISSSNSNRQTLNSTHEPVHSISRDVRTCSLTW